MRLRRSHVLEWRRSDAGQKLKAALEFVRPEAIRKSEIHLPGSNGVSKVAETSPHPNQTAYDRVREELYKCYHALYSSTYDGFVQRADIFTYARPGELTRALAIDVVKKNDQFSHDVIVLSPFERAEASKAGIFDEVLILDDTRMMCLGSIVVQEAAQRIRRGGEEAKLWDFTPAQYLQTWRSCVEVLEVGDVAVSPYQNRHGGASRDHLLRLRSVAAIQRRGRWAVDSSARIYDKPGRLQQTNQQIQSEAAAPGRTDTCSLPGLFLREAGATAKSAAAKGEAPFQKATFLSLFGGVGNPAIAVANFGGRGFVIDLSDSPENDLGLHSKWNPILKHIDDFDFFGIDLPCNTWSRARRAPPWSQMPKPLRKPGTFIYGLPIYLHRIFKKSARQYHAERSVQLIRKCLRRGKAGYLENPRSSMLWKTPEIQRLLCDSRVQLIYLDMCQYGTQWKKPTTLLWCGGVGHFPF